MTLTCRGGELQLFRKRWKTYTLNSRPVFLSSPCELCTIAKVHTAWQTLLLRACADMIPTDTKCRYQIPCHEYRVFWSEMPVFILFYNFIQLAADSGLINLCKTYTKLTKMFSKRSSNVNIPRSFQWRIEER